jgi:hypothetical protein
MAIVESPAVDAFRVWVQKVKQISATERTNVEGNEFGINTRPYFPDSFNLVEDWV